MKLSEIASVTGKGGLFKVVSPTKAGIILESLDASKTKFVATSHHRMSLLHEISIYTTTEEGTAPLEQVLKKVHAEFGNDLGIDANSEPGELKAFLKSVLPDYDEDRVYVSDIKKLVKWYGALLEYAPELLQQDAASKAEDVETKDAEA